MLVSVYRPEGRSIERRWRTKEIKRVKMNATKTFFVVMSNTTSKTGHTDAAVKFQSNNDAQEKENEEERWTKQKNNEAK